MSVRFVPFIGILAVAVTAWGAGVVAAAPPGGNRGVAADVPPHRVAAVAPAWQTTFRDDFSGSGRPDPTKWLLTLGNSYPGGPGGFGTGEIETMTDDPNNVAVRNGNLYITPQRNASGGWTSARVETVRSDLKPPTGGVMHVESRLQMPNVTGAAAKGYWPAFWMLGGPYRADRWSWPRIGEFDIMENVQGLNWTYNVLHCGTWGGPCSEPEGINNGRPGNSGEPCLVTTCQAGFHTYGLEWDRSGPQEQLRWYLDGALTFTVNQSQVPAQTWSDLADHAGYFIILNVAIGGAFPNKLDAGNGGPFPSTQPGVPMVVDYVEVKYGQGSGTSTPPPTTPTTTSPSTTAPSTTAPSTTAPSTTAPSTTAPSTTAPSTTAPTTTGPTTSTGPASSGPSNLRVVSTTGSSITLGWDGLASTSYDVLRSGERIATVSGNRFTDIGLFPNTPYLYSIRANSMTTGVVTARIGSTPPTTSTTGPSPTSTPTTVPTTTSTPTTVPTTTVPTTPATGAPSNLRVSSTTTSTITLAWDGPSGGSYEVLRSGIKIATVSAPSFTDTGLFRNTPYLYSIRGAGGTSKVITASIA